MIVGALCAGSQPKHPYSTSWPVTWAAREASHCMTYNALQSAQHRADRNRQKSLGKALTRLYTNAPADRIPEDLLLLLAEADKRRQPPLKPE